MKQRGAPFPLGRHGFFDEPQPASRIGKRFFSDFDLRCACD